MRRDNADNKPSAGPRLPFSLRWALTTAAFCAIAVGVYCIDDRLINAVLTLMVLALPLGVVIGAAVAGVRGAKGGMIVGAIVGVLAGGLGVVYNLPMPVGDTLLVLLYFALPVMAGLLCWELKQSPLASCVKPGLQIASRLSILVLALVIPLQLLRAYLRDLRPHDSAGLIDLGEVVVMGLALLPWIVIHRRRAAGPAGRPHGRWDCWAKVLLRCSAVIVLLSLALAVLMRLAPGRTGPYSGLGRDLGMMLVLEVGFLAAGCCFAAGFVIQLFRDRWTLPWVLINALWMAGVWAWALMGFALRWF